MITDKKFDVKNQHMAEKMGQEYYNILNAMKNKGIKAFLQDDSFND